MGKPLKNLEKDYTFGVEFFASVKLLAPFLYPRVVDWATILTLSTLLASIANEYITYHMGMYPGKMYGALIGNDKETFWHIFMQGSLLYCAQGLVLGMISLFSWLLYLAWRRNVVHSLHSIYFSKLIYYRLNVIDHGGIDNPDQRMTQDVERMCQGLATKILPGVLTGPCVVAWYTWKTYNTAGFMGIGIIYAYFILGTVVNKFLVSPMVKWNGRVERCEGDFRFKHVTVRTNAESSALYSAHRFEESQANQILHRLLKRQITFALWRFPNAFWQQFFDYYGGLLSYAIQVIPVFILHSYADLDPADLTTKISNNAFIYIYLINSFTKMTDAAIYVGDIAGILQRVADLVRQMRTIENSTTPLDASGQLNSTGENPIVFDLKNVAYSLPNNVNCKLVQDLNMKIAKNQNWLITGNSGAGKTTLLRVLNGIWPINTGVVHRYLAENECIQLPQQPYFPTGRLSFRDQLNFPGTMEQPIKATDAETLTILGRLELIGLMERCGGMDVPIEFQLQEQLTAGEQQRLSFARLLLHRPKLAILDEAMSSVSVEMETNMYNMLKQYGIQYISAGHRDSLLNHHEFQLHLDGKCGYRIQLISSSQSENLHF